MELTDDEREADYQALIASADMLYDRDAFDSYPAQENMTIEQHIKYKTFLLR
jgi:hypothetical protein